MKYLQVTVKPKLATIVFLLILYFNNGVNGYNSYTVHGSRHSFVDPDIVSYESGRVKRDTAAAAQSYDTSNTTTIATPGAHVSANNITEATNGTLKTSTMSTSVAVTQIPLLNDTTVPKVSDPINPSDDDFSDVFRETPEMLQAEHNITNLTYNNHTFYNSTFIGNKTYFDEYWANLTKMAADVHPILSNSHRRATTLALKFDFPFYGHPVPNITVATGGFIYTGEHVHNWLAATQYIAPLMANFDTTLSNDSYVKMYSENDKFIVFWENVIAQEQPNKKFTFAVTLYKSGDIDFAYKDIPVPVQNISDRDHPVKVGISDAYLNDRLFFLVRRKTIYEYHRVNFKPMYNITNSTILKLIALPTCLQYNSCEACTNHETDFNCMWCDAIQKCSSGTDRYKQDWTVRNCDKLQVSNASLCPAHHETAPGDSNTMYHTDTGNTTQDTSVVNTKSDETPQNPRKQQTPAANAAPPEASAHGAKESPQGGHSPVGGVVAALVAITLVSAVAAWALYAFKNPHTRSGQLLIKYRPSQWSWRRGEARYTAATIHM